MRYAETCQPLSTTGDESKDSDSGTVSQMAHFVLLDYAGPILGICTWPYPGDEDIGVEIF